MKKTNWNKNPFAIKWKKELREGVEQIKNWKKYNYEIKNTN